MHTAWYPKERVHLHGLQSFRDISKMQAFAVANSIEGTSKLGRFKVSGIHQAIGLHRLLAFITTKKWINVQVL